MHGAVNHYGKRGTKSGRGGRALLADLLICARCRRRLAVSFDGWPRPSDPCNLPNQMLGQIHCLTFAELRVEAAIAQERLYSVSRGEARRNQSPDSAGYQGSRLYCRTGRRERGIPKPCPDLDGQHVIAPSDDPFARVASIAKIKFRCFQYLKRRCTMNASSTDSAASFR
jgi:hypothetical protein